MRPISSVISGLPSPALAAASSTGLQHGGHGSVTVEQARAKLVTQSPKETDRNLREWLKSSLGVVPIPQGRWMFPQNGGSYQVVTHFEFGGKLKVPREEARQLAAQAIKAATTRPTREDCEEWIATLHAVTARRADDASTLELILNVYCGVLARYPADVAKQACQDFALRREKPNWFPTLSELDEACERMASERIKLAEAFGV